MKQYDFVIVGAGLFGAVCAHELTKIGQRVLVLEKRSHIGGNVYTENDNGIHIHKYGAHIFHTNDKDIWDYVNSFSEFNRFTNSPLANYKGRLFNLPFNMNTFYQMWGVLTPQQAKQKLAEQRSEMDGITPQNLEEQAISLVGRDIYETLIKDYTEKQWGRSAKSLPAFIIKRLPVRFTYDNNYFSDRYQGIPIKGYTHLITEMLKGIEVKTNVDFLNDKDTYMAMGEKIIYTGPIDEYYDYIYEGLEYRTLRFETESLAIDNFQGNAVINYTDAQTTYTRIIEHKHFSDVNTAHTIITKEYPAEYQRGDEPYYPVNDDKNMQRFKKYWALAKEDTRVIFGGRLAEYKYYDMHQVIASALHTVNKIKGKS